MERSQSVVLAEILETLKQIQQASKLAEKETEPQASTTVKNYLPEILYDDLTVAVPAGSRCRRAGCQSIYTGWDRATNESCFYHPGFSAFVGMVNEELRRAYSCCRRLQTYDAMMDPLNMGCQMIEKHLFLRQTQSISNKFVQVEVYFPRVPALKVSQKLELSWSLDSAVYEESYNDSILKDAASMATLQGSDAWDIETGAKRVVTVPYLDWRTPIQNSTLYENHQLTEQLGDAWMVPQDGRVFLRFSRDFLEQLDHDTLTGTCQILAEFGAQMRNNRFLDFRIFDNSSFENEAEYRIGAKALLKGYCAVPVNKDNHETHGPWRRLILCQGLDMVSQPSQELIVGLGEHEDNLLQKVPFLLDDYRYRDTIRATMDHVFCRPRTAPNENHEKTNPYKNAFHSAFHLTFFHLLDATHGLGKLRASKRGTWNHGPLYGREDKLLCESALTVVMVNGAASMVNIALRQVDESIPLEPATEWTVMLLSPPGFYSDFFIKHVFPMQGSLHEICLVILERCFHNLEESWREIRGYLEYLLDERTTIMNPAKHDKLLSDDETFSRSRKYFWAINALGEFLQSISVNIQEWESFQSAAIEPYMNAKLINSRSLGCLENIEVKILGMKNIRSYFATQLEATRVLRDGLFNASAVIESRTSTRLGENVKLLTFVSIFFLPLAFCTSLWSMNDMWSTKVLSYTIVLVGLGTYFVVFNLNNIVTHGSRAYQPIRRRIVDNMKGSRLKNARSNYEGSGLAFWSEQGTKLDLFTPKNEKMKPSEWWIFIFLFTSVWARLKAIGRNKEREVVGEGSPRLNQHSNGSLREDSETDDGESNDLSSTSSFAPSSRISASDHEAEPGGADTQEETPPDNINETNNHESPKASGDRISATSPPEQIRGSGTRESISAASKSTIKRRNNGLWSNLREAREKRRPSTVMNQQNTVILDSSPQDLDVLQEPKTVAQRLLGILRRKQGTSSVERGDQGIV